MSIPKQILLSFVLIGLAWLIYFVQYGSAPMFLTGTSLTGYEQIQYSSSVSELDSTDFGLK